MKLKPEEIEYLNGGSHAAGHQDDDDDREDPEGLK